MIDLRSDTVTQPTPGMRQAIAEAVVGDEQKREDPTVIALERRAAELLGHEDAVFLPTATMSNHIALKLLSHPGDVLIAERHSHVVVYEYGGAAVHAGLMVQGFREERAGSAPSRCELPFPSGRRPPTRRRRSSRSRTRTTMREAASGHSPSWVRSSPPRAGSGCESISTGRG